MHLKRWKELSIRATCLDECHPNDRFLLPQAREYGNVDSDEDLVDGLKPSTRQSYFVRPTMNYEWRR
jgi:hypothetical protein